MLMSELSNYTDNTNFKQRNVSLDRDVDRCVSLSSLFSPSSPSCACVYVHAYASFPVIFIIKLLNIYGTYMDRRYILQLVLSYSR